MCKSLGRAVACRHRLLRARFGTAERILRFAASKVAAVVLQALSKAG